jgi:hypothetical protein
MPDNMVILGGADARNVGLKCYVCNTANVVYHISKPLPPIFNAGSYCYDCLLYMVRSTLNFKAGVPAYMLPYPIPEDLLAKLQFDLRISRDARYVPLKSTVKGDGDIIKGGQ